jgi:hypothetical protein
VSKHLRPLAEERKWSRVGRHPRRATAIASAHVSDEQFGETVPFCVIINVRFAFLCRLAEAPDLR